MARKTSPAKDKICNGLMDLLSKKSIAEVKISELTDYAKVARASFYRNFNNIDDVLDEIADKYNLSFNKKIIPLLNKKDFDLWYKEVHRVLSNIYDKKENFTTILVSNLRMIFDRMEEKNKLDSNHPWATSPFKKYEHFAKTSAFYGVCLEWIRNGAIETIDEMTLFIVNKIVLAE